MKPIMKVQSIVLLAMLVGGCVKPVNSVQINESGAYNSVSTDADLGDKAKVRNVVKNRDYGVLHVQVIVANETPWEQDFIYRWIWIDANKMEVPTPLTNWQRQTILGRQTLTLTGVAPDPKITDCRLEMKKPEN